MQKLTRQGVTLHCGPCGSTCHNIIRLNNIGVPVKSRPKKQQKAGPSQVSQSILRTQASQASPSFFSGFLVVAFHSVSNFKLFHDGFFANSNVSNKCFDGGFF